MKIEKRIEQFFFERSIYDVSKQDIQEFVKIYLDALQFGKTPDEALKDIFKIYKRKKTLK